MHSDYLCGKSIKVSVKWNFVSRLGTERFSAYSVHLRNFIREIVSLRNVITVNV